jgi:hypothetical protein
VTFLTMAQGANADVRALQRERARSRGVPSLAQRWIPVTEAVPAPEVFVLCWDGRQTFVEWFGSKPDAGRGVTHWMPYPMPPGAASEMHDGRRAVA